MSEISGVGGVRGQQTWNDGGAGEVASGPPSLPAYAVVEGLGLESVAAMLVIDAAQHQAKQAKQQSRDLRREHTHAVQSQVAELYAKASCVRKEAVINAVTKSLEAVVTAVGGEKGAAVAKPLSASIDAIAKWQYGADTIEHDANATAWSARAKDADSDRDEMSSVAKTAHATIDKAQQALQSFLQERTMARRAILRAG